MARHAVEEIIFCDGCGVSIPKTLTPFQVKNPDGTVRNLCQECKWAATANEDQPTLAVDEAPDAAEAEAAGGAPTPGPAPLPESVEAEVVPEGPVPGGLTFTRSKSFVCKAAPQALDFNDEHIAAFVKQHGIRLKHTTMCHGLGAVGSQGIKDDAIFITIWW